MAGSPLLLSLLYLADANGNPLAGGKLESYLAGTSTPSPLYTTAALAVAHPNPAIFDGNGVLVAFMDALAYKFILKNAAGTTLYTVDNVQSLRVVTGDLGISFHFGGNEEVPIVAVAYPAGTAIAALHGGTSIMRVNTATLPVGDYQLEGMLQSVSGVTVTAGLVNLTDGTPDTALTGSEIASTNTNGEYKISANITLPAGGSNKDLAVKVKVSAGTGFAWGFNLRKVA